ncbi:MAG TPA: hypothetical protein DCZ72_06605 [Armatimonadetes bacterium]|nr:hypothetical protein [Armatimonadota bacterium]
MASADGKLAVVLTGTAGYSAALLGGLEALEAAGLRPDVVVGASGGALAGALYATSGGAAAAREAYYGFVAKHSWQDLADLDFGGLSAALRRPHETQGLVGGERLFQALRSLPLGNKGFQHTDVPLFVVTTDLNSGQALVFGNQTREQVAEGLPYLLFARSESDLERVNVATAVRASLAVPGVFRPLVLDYFCLVDGGLRARQALSVAAAQPGVTRVIWLQAGLEPADAFSLVSDFAQQSAGAGLLQALTVAAADAFDPHSADPALANIALRVVNLATSSAGAVDLVRTQALYESGRRTLESLFETAGSGEKLLANQPNTTVGKLREVTDEEAGPRWAWTVGAGGNVLAVTDRNPTLISEYGFELDDALAAANRPKLTPAEPLANPLWLRGQTETAGLWSLAGWHLWNGCGYVCRGVVSALKVAADAVGLDVLWTKATKATAEGAATLVDTLRDSSPAVAAPPTVEGEIAEAEAPVADPAAPPVPEEVSAHAEPDDESATEASASA